MARRVSEERAKTLSGGFATARKKIVIQYGGRERDEQAILQSIQQKLEESGVPDDEINLVKVYIKPEDHAVYYVVNDKHTGSVEF